MTDIVERLKSDRELFEKADRRMEIHVGHYPPIWNNMPERTGAEVVAAMRECAAQ